jgi:hypothetical protein
MTVSVNGTTGITFNDASIQNTAATGFGFKNRIINGAMMIDQRNAGAAVTADASYPVDRFLFRETTDGTASVQQSTTAPTGFVNSLLFTVTSTDSSLASNQYAAFQHRIEGFNIADLGWGTANAQPVTVSFWVRSSVTGAFGASLSNSAGNRSYPFSYTISAANTFEYKTVTIAGDTSGTWLTTNGIGIQLNLTMGAASNLLGTANTWAGSFLIGVTGDTNLHATSGATFYITGVQLEKGSTATSFDYRPYTTELQLCQRYYYKASGAGPFTNGFNVSSTLATGVVPFPVPMRTSPSALEQTGTASNYRVITNVSTACSAVPYFEDTNTFASRVVFTVASGLTGGQGNMLYTASGVTAFLAWSAEL